VALLLALPLYASFIRSHHSRTARPFGKAVVRWVDDGDAWPSPRRRKWPAKLSELPARSIEAWKTSAFAGRI